MNGFGNVPAAGSPRSGARPPGIAFFDLDRTLLACNSAVPWLFEELRAGNIGAFGVIRALGWLAWYRLGAGNLERALLASFAAGAGRDARETERRIAEWYRRELRGRMRPGGLAALEAHRARGEWCVLLTSGTQHLSALVARDLALEDAVCTLLETDRAGRYTGHVVGRACFGSGKAAAAAGYAAGAGVPLSCCTFYSDSTSDLPTLEAVGHPVAVNPDPRLRRVARARGWPVVDWGTPAAPCTRAAD